MTQPVAFWIVRIAFLYLTLGVIFAIPFVVSGAGRIDPAAHKTSWLFRLLLLTGSTLLWPILLARWLRGRQTPDMHPSPREGEKS